MLRSFLFILFIGCATAAFAQTTPTFFSTFDAERGTVLALASDGNLWLGGMKDERVLITKLSPDGQVLEKHSLNFGPGLDADYLVNLFEAADGKLVGCGNFETDAAGRGFVFSYDPVKRVSFWSQIVQSDFNYLAGITELGPGGDYVLYGNPHFGGGDDAELIRFDHTTGQIVPDQAKRYNLGTSDKIHSMVMHNGALYGRKAVHHLLGFHPPGGYLSALPGTRPCVNPPFEDVLRTGHGIFHG